MALFVGRTEELARLDQSFSRALAGSGGTVFITAEAGAGKSTLIERFRERAADFSPETLFIRAGCSEQYGAGEPYQPFVEAFRDLLARQESEPRRRSLRELAREVAPFWLATIPVAGDILAAGLATAAELRPGAAASAPSEEALFFQYTELFFAAARERPLVLIIDDLHWADRATVSLLTHIARKLAAERVLVIGTYRPVDVAVTRHPIRDARLELERYHLAEELPLPPLGTDHLADFITGTLGAPPSGELLDWLHTHAGTNALFFEELLKWLVDQGLAERHKDRWRLARLPSEVDIPRSAESTIERRLQRLDESVYRVLEYASVVGDEFDSVTLSRLLDMDELELEDVIDPLVRVHQLVRSAGTRDLPDGEPASAYEFSHSLFQDVLTKNLQGKRRILLHRKVAGILEDIHGADLTAVAHKLAIHYDEGRLAERACEYALLAADRAERLYAHWDAIAMIERAQRNAAAPRQRLDALRRLGTAKWIVGRYPESLDAFAQALAAAREEGDAVAELALRRQILLVERDQGARPAREILDLMAGLAAEAEEQEAHEEFCQILWHSIDLPGTDAAQDVVLARRALDTATRLANDALLAKGHLALGMALMFHDDANLAVEHLQRALDLASRTGDLPRVGRCHNCLAVTRIMLGDYATASAAFQEAAAAFEKVGDPFAAAAVRNNAGALLMRTGDWDRAEATLHQAIGIWERIDAAPRLLHPLQNLAELAHMRGDHDTALTRWHEVLERARSVGYWSAEVIAHCGIGMIRLERGDIDGARAAEGEALSTLPEQESWTESREAFQLLAARLAAAAGETSGAAELLHNAETALESRDRYVWATFRLARAEILADTDRDTALALAREAAETFERFGARPMLERARALAARH
jgi:tetratricopeptide (TPR) repeat protein